MRVWCNLAAQELPNLLVWVQILVPVLGESLRSERFPKGIDTRLNVGEGSDQQTRSNWIRGEIQLLERGERQLPPHAPVDELVEALSLQRVL